MALLFNRRIIREAGMRNLCMSSGDCSVFSRFSFHIIEGLRYVIESYRWRRHLERLPS
jgi:hypothetical protein